MIRGSAITTSWHHEPSSPATVLSRISAFSESASVCVDGLTVRSETYLRAGAVLLSNSERFGKYGGNPAGSSDSRTRRSGFRSGDVLLAHEHRSVKVGVIQSSYVPWRGYFDFIRSVDLFVVYDDVQYSKGGWRNRNRLKVQVRITLDHRAGEYRLGQTIDEVEISIGQKSWTEGHARLLRESLSEAPHFSDAWEIWSLAVEPNCRRLSQLNVHLLKAVCEYLGFARR